LFEEKEKTMKTFLLVVALSLTTLATAGPVDFTIGTAFWSETYVSQGGGIPGKEGAAGNILNANGDFTFFDDPTSTIHQFEIKNAISGGGISRLDPLSADLFNQYADEYKWLTDLTNKTGLNPGGEYDYVTEYWEGKYFDSFFDVWFDIRLVNFTDIDPPTLDNPFFVTYGYGEAPGIKGSSIKVVAMGNIQASDPSYGNAGDLGGYGTICVPAPGALLLGSLGLGLVGAIRRRLA
jgi:hypothetical protein